mmetsp:Transcript_99364/g.160204  ORF Transcript_99364/g.160204 Transcript_99364/m.160204 type:complete len:214 (-) Transcript_99364:1270-1911(-)
MLVTHPNFHWRRSGSAVFWQAQIQSQPTTPSTVSPPAPSLGRQTGTPFTAPAIGDGAPAACRHHTSGSSLPSPTPSLWQASRSLRRLRPAPALKSSSSMSLMSGSQCGVAHQRRFTLSLSLPLPTAMALAWGRAGARQTAPAAMDSFAILMVDRVGGASGAWIVPTALLVDCRRLEKSTAKISVPLRGSTRRAQGAFSHRHWSGWATRHAACA